MDSGTTELAQISTPQSFAPNKERRANRRSLTNREKAAVIVRLMLAKADPNASTNTIGRLGPIGLALELRKPAFTMHISKVEEGSPAAKTGKLKPGQIIESINGETLKDTDPRVILGNLITKIEATDGVVRMMIKDILTKNGFEVAGEAQDGSQAIEKYKELEPDLVTMDITMPEMDGITALKEIKSTSPEAKIIMCSAMGQQAMVIDAIQAGAKDFIVKPFNAERVVEAVSKTVAQ